VSFGFHVHGYTALASITVRTKNAHFRLRTRCLG
jgi:hypothetical protein